MTPASDDQTRRTNRRRFLTGLGATLGTIGAIPPRTRAQSNGGRTPLATGPLDFKIYSSLLGSGGDDNPDTPAEFAFPDGPTSEEDPMFEFHDPSGTAFFDPSVIEMTPNGNTLHHALQFFNGWIIDRMPKPYSLVHEQDGRYTERGQTMNFTARSLEEIMAELSDLADQLGMSLDKLLELVNSAPLEALAGKRWRAVGNDVVQLVAKGDSRPIFALTRIDFYSRGGGQPELDQSLLYVIWPDGAPDDGDLFPGPILPGVREEAKTLIEAGAANLGGQ